MEPTWPDIMDPNAWQAYHQAAAAYSNRFSGGGGGQDDHHPPYHNPLSLLASASHHYQHNILPPSLLAAQHNKSGGSLTNTILTPPVTPVSSWDSAVAQRRSVIEASQAKASQPAFPGQPPPLQDARRIEASSPAFPGQPPPRQSSQPRSQIFPGTNHSNHSSHSSHSSHYSQQQHSPGYGNNYSPGAPSPQAYSNVQSPQDYHSSHSSQRRDREDRDRHQRDRERTRLEQEMRERQKEKERLERQRIAEERREQERIRQEQEFRREQERIRQEKEREEKARRDREKAEQEERRRREREKIEQERRKREEEERRRREEERRRELERLDQQRKEQEERDLGLARLSAMGTLNDLGEENQNYHHYEQENSNNFNINMFQYQQNMIKQEHHEQKPLVQFNNWINRASELLDLSSSDSRDNSGQTDEQSSNFIPQILMNPWDPQQAPMMTLAPIANAMQQYQQQWLTQYQQAAGMLNQEEGSFPLGKFRVLCISPDEDMGFLINLPPPCNLLFQQEALVQKCVDSPFILVFQNFLKDPALSNQRKHLCEAPDRPPPYIEQDQKLKAEVKKEYVPPYTPRATHDPDSKAKLSSSGYSRSLEITPVRRSAVSRHQRTASQSQARPTTSNNSGSSSAHSSGHSSVQRAKQAKKNVSDDEEDELPEIRKFQNKIKNLPVVIEY